MVCEEIFIFEEKSWTVLPVKFLYLCRKTWVLDPAWISFSWNYFDHFDHFKVENCRNLTIINNKPGDFFDFFSSYKYLYSSLRHLPPLRFHCVGGCRDRILKNNLNGGSGSENRPDPGSHPLINRQACWSGGVLRSAWRWPAPPTPSTRTQSSRPPWRSG